MKMLNLIVLPVVLLLTLSTTPATAGSFCEPGTSHPGRISAALTMALTLRTHLDANVHEAAIVARVGNDISDRGLKYTHAAVVVRDVATRNWVVVHQLNHCGLSTSSLFTEGLGTFFTDDPYMLDVLVVVPAPDVQRRLRELVQSDAVDTLHEPSYSMLASPYSERYQNSNGWLLELLALAHRSDTARVSRSTAHRILKASDFEPTIVSVSPVEKLGASLFRANVQFDDHPVGSRLRGEYEVVSVRSVVDWLKHQDPATVSNEIAAPGDIRYPRTAFPAVAAAQSARQPDDPREP